MFLNILANNGPCLVSTGIVFLLAFAKCEHGARPPTGVQGHGPGSLHVFICTNACFNFAPLTPRLTSVVFSLLANWGNANAADGAKQISGRV